jgi:hypothetical protein
MVRTLILGQVQTGEGGVEGAEAGQ